MGLFEVLLLAVGLAMDAFAVSICKGLAAGKVTKKDREYFYGHKSATLWFVGLSALLVLIRIHVDRGSSLRQ